MQDETARPSCCLLAGPKRMADEPVPDGTKYTVIKHTVMLTQGEQGVIEATAYHGLPKDCQICCSHE